jgi:hypothetical protein
MLTAPWKIKTKTKTKDYILSQPWHFDLRDECRREQTYGFVGGNFFIYIYPVHVKRF